MRRNYYKSSFLNTSGLMLIVLFLSSLNFSFRTFSDITTSLINPEVFHRIAGFFILSVYVLYKSPKIYRTIKSNKFLIFFTCYCLYRILSSTWSIFPIWSLYRSVEFLIVGMFFISLLDKMKSEVSLINNLNRIIILYLCLLVTVILGIFHSPDAIIFSENLIPKLQGIIPRWNSNGIGQAAAIIIGLILVRLGHFRRRNDILVLVFVGVIFLLAQTRSALAPLLIFALILFSTRVNLFVRMMVYIVIGIFSIFLVFSNDTILSIYEYIIRGQTSEQLLTLSGRLIAWEASIVNADFGWIRFLFGLGSFAGGRYIAELNYASTSQGAPITTLDNAWLELWVDEGIIGIIFLSVLFIWIYKLLRQSDRQLIKWSGYCLFTILLFRSFFVSNLLLHTNFFFLTLVLIGAVLEQQRRVRPVKSRLHNIPKGVTC